MFAAFPNWMKVGWRDANGDLRCILWADSREELEAHALQFGGSEPEAYYEFGGKVCGLMPVAYSNPHLHYIRNPMLRAA